MHVMAGLMKSAINPVEGHNNKTFFSDLRLMYQSSDDIMYLHSIL